MAWIYRLPPASYTGYKYTVANAASLPFIDNQFDLVVVYNVLIDVEDVPATLKEIRRVTRANGELFMSLVHPFRDRGNFASMESDAPFALRSTHLFRAATLRQE